MKDTVDLGSTRKFVCIDISTRTFNALVQVTSKCRHHSKTHQHQSNPCTTHPSEHTHNTLLECMTVGRRMWLFRANKHQCGDPPPSSTSFSPYRVKFGMALHRAGAKFQHTASWKFCPTIHRIYTPRVIDIGLTHTHNGCTYGHLTGL